MEQKEKKEREKNNKTINSRPKSPSSKHAPKDALNQVLFDQKLKEKMSQEKFKYDFKYIQKEFETSDQMSVKYLDYAELDSMIRNPLN